MHMDAGRPLNWQDFARASELEEEDFAPKEDEAPLYSSSLFEGDIVKPELVSCNSLTVTHM